MSTATSGKSSELGSLVLTVTPYENFDAENNQPLDRRLVITKVFPIDQRLQAIDLLSDKFNDVRFATILDINVFDDLLVLSDGIYRVIVSDSLQ
jgi:hypothetical protein